MHSVKDLLSRALPAAAPGGPNLTRVTHQASAQVKRRDAWKSWFEAHLPPDITGKISEIVEREGVLAIYAESAAWSARLRYAVLEVESQLRQAHPAITEISVRVLPRPAKR